MTEKENPVIEPLLTLLENAPIGAIMIGQDGRIFRVNQYFSDFTGYSKDEIRMMNIRDIHHPDDREKNWAPFVDVESAPETYRMEIRYIHKQGHEIWGLIQGTSKYSTLHAEVAYLGFIHDITPLKKQEEELRATKEKYESLIHNSSDVFVLYDLEGHILEVNEAYTRVTGWEPGDVIGKKLPISTADKMEESMNIIRYVGQGGMIENLELVRKGKNGVRIEVSTSISPIHNARGEIIMIAAIGREIGQQKTLSRRAQQQEKMLKQLVDNWPDAFMIVQDGKWVYSNSAGLDLLGGSKPEQVIGSSVLDYHPPEDHEFIQLEMEQTHRGYVHRSVRQKITNLDGRVIDTEVTSMPAYFEEESPAIHVVLRDVTERIKTEEYMRLSDKLNAVGQLAAGIAHEIRNPLTAIKGFIQLIQNKYPESGKYFDIIKSEVERIDLITGELLLLAKPNLKSAKPLDLGELLEQVRLLLDTQCLMNNIELLCNYKAKPQPVIGDANQLKQVFVNLLKNAVEAMPKGGQIQLIVDADTRETSITIQDQGPGIPLELMNNIGRPFYTTKQNGTGLGLMVSYKIVQDHGGSIHAENIPQAGAAFTIKLPIAQVKDVSEEKEAASSRLS
ncbi:PAS domain S-box protein [Paenibacillus aestuarii]|uniref:histidine kinase n=1 Tax=Paenibacillus aestuarii TaxID=516965 RepID=A0ABW0K8J7_9BACL|nr:PAS domain S-box protein [Paenibacillus aestuarii]